MRSVQPPNARVAARRVRGVASVAMRDEAAALGPTIRALAEKHGVSPRTIARIAIAERWA